MQLQRVLSFNRLANTTKRAIFTALFLAMLIVLASSPSSSSPLSPASSVISFANAFSKDIPQNERDAALLKARAAKGTEGGSYASINSPEHKKKVRTLPDLTHKPTKAALVCNACVASARELFLTLFELKVSRAGKPSYIEWVDTLTQVCTYLKEHYGLAVEEETEKPTLFFRSDTEVKQHINGGWVADMLAERCDDLTTNYESEIIKYFKSDKVPFNPYTDVSTKGLSADQQKAMAAYREQLTALEQDFTVQMCVKLEKKCADPAKVDAARAAGGDAEKKVKKANLLKTEDIEGEGDL